MELKKENGKLYEAIGDREITAVDIAVKLFHLKKGEKQCSETKKKYKDEIDILNAFVSENNITLPELDEKGRLIVIEDEEE